MVFEQIIGVLKESEAGIKTSELKYGISTGTFYKWKDKYGGPEFVKPFETVFKS